MTAAVAHNHSAAQLSDYWQLAKPRVMALVVFTGLAGLLAAPVTPHLVISLTILLAIALAAGGAGAINMWYDADIDRRMERTKNRPIPRGAVEADDALAMGLGLIIVGVMLMALAANVTAAALLAFSAFFYAVIYTMLLKRRTPQNIVIGGAAGAFPPVIAWAATGAGLDASVPWLLFLVIFLWTPPHFWALALRKKQEYAAVNVPMMPNVAGDASTKKQMLYYGLLTVAASLALAFALPHPWVFAALAIGLGVWFMHQINLLLVDQENASAMRLFAVSICYLFALFLGVMGVAVL